MIYSELIAVSLVTLFSLVTLLGTAVFAILRSKSYSHNDAHKKDIISQVPDDILVSIIMRMPAKFAIRTSMLSKRWSNLYKIAPQIDLCCGDLLWRRTPGPGPPGSDVIIYRLETFLRLFSGSKIRSFELHCCLTKSYTDRFEKCIYSLGQLGIEELLLYFSCYWRPSDLSFSCHLLSEIPSLKYFLLGSCSLQPSLKGKCCSLQTLHLLSVTVLLGSLECILSSCLRLHSLSITKGRCPSKLCFRGPNLQLKTLKIEHCNGVEEIEFYASNLTTFEFQTIGTINFICDHVPQLQTVYLSLESKNIVSHVFGKLDKDLPHLKSLTFNTEGDFYQGSRRLMRRGMEMFSNLRQLELSVCCAPKINLLALIPFLQSCPLLQEFHLDIRNVQYEGAKPEKPGILHLELKKVEISGFSGTENEIEFALYILKSAVALEQMHISWCPKYYIGSGRWRRLHRLRWSEETRKMIEKQLQGQTLAKTAQVVIVYIY